MARIKRWGVIAVTLLSTFANTSCSAQPGSGEGELGNSAQQQSSTNQPHVNPGNDNWPRFRGPSGMGASDATGLPVKWNENENIAWKTALPGAGASSPVVFDDHIYLTSYTGYLVPGESGGSLDDLKRHLICLRRDDGKILWNQAVKATLPEKDRVRDHGYAANTPAADTERVYTFFGKSGVFAFDHQGNQLWQADVGSNTNGWGTAASPVLYKDLVHQGFMSARLQNVEMPV